MFKDRVSLSYECNDFSSKRGKNRISELALKLLKHYDQTARIFPWRISPESYKRGVRPDSYKIWISEIMLQQTRVITVKDYYEKFIDRFPTVHDLANAEEDAVLTLWAGLGYYSRARNLHACAKVVSDRYQGVFPESEKELLTLPGVGAYTAGAIRTIAFNKTGSPVDGNIERVFSRLFIIKDAGKDLRKIVQSAVLAHIPDHRPGDFIQALMDLGSEICTPKKPKCLICPIRELCEGRERGDPESYPVKKAKKPAPVHIGMMTITENSKGKLFLRKRENKGLFGGMYEFPFTHAPAEKSEAIPKLTDNEQIIGEVKHIFTHFTLFLKIIHCKAEIQTTSENGIFFDPGDEKKFPPLPKLMRKALEVFEKRKVLL